MSKEKNLAKNTLLYAVGNIGSKVLSFLIVPLYTYYINTSDMGVYDAIFTAVALFAPVVVFSVYEGVYRWSISDKDNAGKYIRYGLVLEIRNLSIVTIFYFIAGTFFNIPFFYTIYIYSVTLCLHTYFTRITRALGNTKLVAINGFIYSCIYLSLNVVFITIFDLGIVAFFYSSIIGNTITTLIMFFKQVNDIFDSDNESLCSSDKKEIIKYSLAITPNDICWWLVGVSDRFFLIWFVGSSANGIYSVSQKFPTIITMLTSIFYMAWQDQALSTIDEDDKDLYYTKIFNFYERMLLCGTICLIPITKYVIIYFMETSYHDAWFYVMPLYLGTAFSALASFLGIGYQGGFQNTRALISTGTAATVNILLNVMFIPLFKEHSIWIVSISTCISYFVLFAIRFFHSRRYFCIDANFKEMFLLSFFCVFLGVVVLYTDVYYDIILAILAFIIIVHINVDYLKFVWVYFRKKLGNKKN